MSGKPVKLAFFSPNLSGGGAERVISILAADFSQQEFEVDLVLVRAAGAYMSTLPPAVNIIDLECGRVLFSAIKLIKYLKRAQPDFLFTSQMHSSTIALWAVRIACTDTKVIVRQPTMLEPKFKEKRLGSGFRRSLLLWSARNWAYRVVVSSQRMADEFLSLSKIPHHKVAVIYNPLPIAHIRHMSNEPLDHPWFKNMEPPVILAVGRMEQVKDFHTLITAFSLVRKKVNARLVILGDGPLKQHLQKLVQDLDVENDVLMPGFANNPFSYMKRARVFVSSSLWEGFPNALIEAMACGASIVATDCDGGTSEILEEGAWGELVAVKSPDDMAQGILRILVDDNLPDVGSRAAEFDVSKVVSHYYELLGLADNRV